MEIFNISLPLFHFGEGFEEAIGARNPHLGQVRASPTTFLKWGFWRSFPPTPSPKLIQNRENMREMMKISKFRDILKNDYLK